MTNNEESKMEESEKHEHERVTIIVNARPKEWNKEEISYEEVIALAFGSYSDDPNIVYSVSYKKGNESGSLVKGESVRVKNGMIFNVKQTNKS